MTKKKSEYHISEADKKLFRDEMAGARPIADKHTQNKSQHSKSAIKRPSEQHSLHDSVIERVGTEQFIEFKRSGIQTRLLQQLRKGQMPLQRLIDLHGLIIAEARRELMNFIDLAVHENIRYIRVIHGKGQRGGTGEARIKNQVNTWLRQIPQVLAFCSCQPKHGGAGAVYVLLKTASFS